MYGCEIWCYGNNSIIERVQLKFLKYLLGLKSTTATCIVYGETGDKPLHIDIETRIISYWSKLLLPENNKLASSIYKCVLSNLIHTPNLARSRFSWLKNVQNILIKCGLNNVWDTNNYPNCKWLTETVKQKLSDLFLNEWFSDLEQSGKCRNYKLFKTEFKYEKYLIYTNPKQLKYMIKLRTRNNSYQSKQVAGTTQPTILEYVVFVKHL